MAGRITQEEAIIIDTWRRFTEWLLLQDEDDVVKIRELHKKYSEFRRAARDKATHAGQVIGDLEKRRQEKARPSS
jgi:hypothetical protein